MPILFLVQIIVFALILKATGVSNSVIGAFLLSAIGDTTGDISGLLTSAVATPLVGVPTGFGVAYAAIIFAKKFYPSLR